MIDKTELQLLQQALEKLEQGFSHLPEFTPEFDVPAASEVLQRVGFVPHLPPPLKMPVAELVQFAAGVCGADPDHMRSVADRLGLDVDAVRSVAARVDPLRFDRIYGGWWGRVVASGAKAKLNASIDRYVSTIEASSI